MTNEAPLVTVLTSIVVAIVSTVLAARAFRGRREGIASTCGGCGYDVSQRPPGVERCSECGADLAAPRAIRTTRRVVNRWLAIPVTLVAVVALLGSASLIVQVPWVALARRHVPLAWIEALARHNHDATGDPYRTEWQRREGVSPALLDHLLDVQGDPTTNWRAAFDGPLAGALNAGTMSDAQRDRYVPQLFGAPTIRVRTPVRAGDPLAIEVSSTLRGAPRVAEWETLAARADGDATIADRYWSVGSIAYVSRRTIAAADWDGVAIAPGPHRVNVRVRRQLITGRNAPPNAADAIGPAVEDSATLDVDVLPASAPIGVAVAVAVAAPAQADAIARAIAAHAYHWHDGRCFAEVRLFPAPVDRAFAVFAVIDGVERKIGSVCAAANEAATTDAIYVPLSIAQATTRPTLTIRLVGDDAPLAQTIDQRKYWPGRITFFDVPIGTSDDYGDSIRKTPTTLPYRVEPDAGLRKPDLRTSP